MKTSLTPTIAAASEHRNECPLSSHSAINGIPTMTMVVQGQSPSNDLLPAAETSDANAWILNQSEECNPLTCEHFMDAIKPTDSISNVFSKKNK